MLDKKFGVVFFFLPQVGVLSISVFCTLSNATTLSSNLLAAFVLRALCGQTS